MVLKEKESYNKLTQESFEKINNLDKKVDTDRLVFKHKAIPLMKNLANLIMVLIV